MNPYFETDNGKLYNGDVMDVLQELPDGIVQCCVTSPPYWGLRDYGISGQLGLEETPEEYIDKMVRVFREVKRVLRDDGALWLNMGDCYCGSTSETPSKRDNSPIAAGTVLSQEQRNGRGERTRGMLNIGLKPKDLVGMPWRLAFALQADGWYLRSDIIWAKPNSMPESVKDRPTKSHEYVFLMSKQAKYYYDSDAVREAHKREWQNEKWTQQKKYGTSPESMGQEHEGNKTIAETYNEAGRNKRTVWTIPTQPYSEAHFATFPTALVIPCIKAGTSEKGNCSVCGKPWVREIEKSMPPDEAYTQTRGSNDNMVRPNVYKTKGSGQKVQDWLNKHPSKTIGWKPQCTCNTDTVKPIVLDPFMGSGTVAEVCERYSRRWIGIELSPEYCDIAVRRISKESNQMKLEFA
jgi:DNA modification methylase